MWRVIVRVSYFSDHQSRLRNHVAGLFATMGLQNTNTGTWESPAVPLTLAATQMGQILQTLADPRALGIGIGPHTALNHFWVYIDRV